MYISDINIRNFRNISSINLKLSEKINIFYGDNAQGKTNFLETIYFINFFKSFRSNKNKDLIKFDENSFVLEAGVFNNYTKNNLKIIFSNNSKKVLINNKKPDLLNFYRILNSILYYPYEVNLLLSNSSYRRNLIDRSIFIIESDYINIIRKYNKILRNRNLFLKNNKYTFDPWIDQLIEVSSKIINKRNKYINKVNSYFNSLYDNNKINEKYEIRHKKYVNVKDDLAKKYIDLKDKEFNFGYTLLGAHLDNINFYINNKNIRKYSSEGQKKYLLLNFKLFQMKDYYSIFNDYPVLLLDDFKSELDNKRKNNFLDKILENSGQIFMTSTDLLTELQAEHRSFEIKNGIITESK